MEKSLILGKLAFIVTVSANEFLKNSKMEKSAQSCLRTEHESKMKI
jgi:hypothetical protein